MCVVFLYDNGAPSNDISVGTIICFYSFLFVLFPIVFITVKNPQVIEGFLKALAPYKLSS